MRFSLTTRFLVYVRPRGVFLHYNNVIFSRNQNLFECLIWNLNLNPKEPGLFGYSGGAQCVELKLRWRFCVHPEIYLFIIKVLDNFFKHHISTRICSEAYLKHHWGNCLQKLNFFTSVRVFRILIDTMFNNCS